MAASSARIVVTGLIAQHPRLGGAAWDYVQYAAGLAELGHDVYYLEDSGEWPYTLDGGPSGTEWVAQNPSPNLEYLSSVLERFGLGDRWMYRFATKPRWYGLSHRTRREVLASADLLLNVSGTLLRPAEYRHIPRLAYTDSDPAFTQLKLQMPRGQAAFRKRVEAHDVFFSFGECLAGTPAVNRQSWRPTRQPVLLSEWRTSSAPRDVFTTVMSWTSFKPLRHGRTVYGQKDIEMARFAELPQLVGRGRLEIALGSTRHADWELPGRNGHRSPRELLADAGWRVIDAGSTCADLDGYRHYVQSSKGEWSVAKNGYVAGRTGWFSCRSACYLAAGRPVVVQDTGFGDVLPLGEGLFSFDSLDEAAEAIRQVESDYARHAAAARALAEEYFDSRKVLAELVDAALSA